MSIQKRSKIHLASRKGRWAIVWATDEDCWFHCYAFREDAQAKFEEAKQPDIPENGAFVMLVQVEEAWAFENFNPDDLTYEE